MVLKGEIKNSNVIQNKLGWERKRDVGKETKTSLFRRRKTVECKKQTAEVLHSHHKKCQRLHEYCDTKQDDKTEILPYVKHLADKWKQGPQTKF